jgi:fused signal recognition particle receptor
MHDLIIAIVAAVVVVSGGATGVIVRRGRHAGPPSTPGTSTRAPTTADQPVLPAREPRKAGPPTRERGGGGEPAGATAPSVEPGVPSPTDTSLAATPVDERVPSLVDVEPDIPPGGTVARPRLRDRLGKARSLFGGYLAAVRSKDRIDAGTWDDLEEGLILADVGVEVTESILGDLRSRAKTEGLNTPDQLIDGLRSELIERLGGDRELHIQDGVTNVWLFVGVNGVGKTTTIGKLGRRQRDAGHRVVMAAGDTFRAAAAEQLALWAERTGTDLVRGNEGGDPGAVIFDAVQHAAAIDAHLVLADTAGRLHTKVNLMEELKKVHRVAQRPPGHVSEVLLVIDATTGQNGLIQAKQFADAVGVTGVVLTKLDGTAKGGIAIAIQSELGLPIKLVGIGESADDLIEFDPVEFVDALVTPDT